MPVRIAATALLAALIAGPASADQEAPNRPVEVASPDGACLARSMPGHDMDPVEGPRQEGTTEVFRVIGGETVLLQRYDWYSSGLYVLCEPGAGGDAVVVRLGPWARGHVPIPQDLALAIYRNGRLVREYSTFDIAGGQEMDLRSYQSSVSHYRVFASGPDLVDGPEPEARAIGKRWAVTAETFDGRVLTFELETGRLR